MNQDFGLSLTPANARRLLRFQEIFNIELPSELTELAEQDLISEDCFDKFVCRYNNVTRTITQFLLDCNLRGIVQQNYHPEFSETELLNTINITKPSHITIITGRSDLWQKTAKTLFIKNNIHFFNYFAISSEDMDKLREGVLIIDFDTKLEFNNMTRFRDFACEFPQTLLFSSLAEDTERLILWTSLARILFPTMPHPLYPRLVKSIPIEWENIPLSLFATFYNMCLFPEYITDPKIIELMNDDNKSFHNVSIL